MQKAALSVIKTGMTVVAVVDKVLPSSLIVTIQRVTGAAESHHALSGELVFERNMLTFGRCQISGQFSFVALSLQRR